MRVVLFDCFAGISGDMTVGAFIDAGMPLEHLQRAIEGLGLDAELSTRIILRNHIRATKFDVALNGEPHAPHTAIGESRDHRDHDHEHGAHDHSSEHHHEQSDGHTHAHSHAAHEHGESSRHGRSHADIIRLIDASTLSPKVKETVLRIFQVIAEAESHVHGVPVEDVHFHEVGAVDSIVDIVGAAVALEYFNIDHVHSTVVRLGSGSWLNTQHGAMPTPAPATVEILRGYPVVYTDVPFELTTPTGAGIVKALSSGVLPHESFVPERIGYGAGARDVPGIANMLRVVIGTIEDASHDQPVMLETNIDNLDPEIYPYVIERLFEAGAHDAFLVPIVMKKGRPGVMLSALVPQPRVGDALAVIYAETSTLGVRITSVGRNTLRREESSMHTSLGSVRVKSVSRAGAMHHVPEFEECRRIARERGLPLQDVRQRLLAELNHPHQPLS